MFIFFLLIEIGVVGYLARRLGAEADDKGLSNALFVALAVFLWIGSRTLGGFLGYIYVKSSLIALLCGWLLAIITYMVFYYFIAKMADKQPDDEDRLWKERNQPNQAQTETPEEK